MKKNMMIISIERDEKWEHEEYVSFRVEMPIVLFIACLSKSIRNRKRGIIMSAYDIAEEQLRQALSSLKASDDEKEVGAAALFAYRMALIEGKSPKDAAKAAEDTAEFMNLYSHATEYAKSYLKATNTENTNEKEN